MVVDFSFILVVLAALTGAIWAFDRALLARRRGAAAREPIVVEYARSFFPIILIVLVVRSFLFEPFRIPSDSMMPTLLDGDFIFVSKYAYGLRLPVANTKFYEIGAPERGDVIVFRKPADPSVNYIKRLVGLPGDRIQVRGDAIWVNGRAAKVDASGPFTDDECYRNFREGEEQLGGHRHRMMYCPGQTTSYGRGCQGERNLNECLAPLALASSPVGADVDFETVVPEGHYFFMGDNRDNSQDSRFPEVGFVPEGNLVGKAVRIWLSWGGGSGPNWDRIGMAIR
ncbi:MAG: signal peptidase I [Steroidobacteraceae bacterium]|nr:signal peptidase I [Steroidobacteraceae bacterium]